MSEPAALPTEADPLRAARQRRRRDRALLLTPALAFGLVILTIWALVIWHAVERPRELLEEQRRELASAVRTLGLQTEPVLRQAEAGLRNVDLWLLSHRGDDLALDDPTLTLLANGVRAGSRQIVDVMLVARTGKLRRLQAQGEAGDGGSIEGSAAFAQISGLVPEDMVIGLPLQLDSGRTWLPLLMRLSRPLGDYNAVLAVIDLKRLQALQALHIPGPLASLVMLRTDGVTLSRQPHLPGFVGRNLFDEFPARRNELAADEGFFASTGATTDGRQRMGAFVTLHDFNLKLLLSDTEDAALAAHRAQRTVVIAAAALVTLGLFLLGRWLSQLQRAARLRAAALQATSDAIPLGLFRCDETGRMVYANDSYLRLHGIGREDMAWGWTRLIQPEHRDLMIQRWKQTVADGEAVDVVRKLRRADNGQLRWIALRAAPLYFDGQVAGLAGTVEDVTERGEQEKARQTLAAIFDITPDIVCQTRANGDLIYMNPAARARFGLAADAPLDNARIEQFIPARQARAYRRLVLAQATRHGHWRGHALLQLGDEQVPMDFTVLVHSDLRGHTETVSAILRDVSAQARAQRERERSEAMLLAVAHTARAGLIVSDTEGRVIFFNAAFEQQRQKLLTDWVGRPLAELFGPPGYAARAALIATALAGKVCRQELADEVDRDGRSYDLQYAPLRVQSGEIEGVICIEVDVTEARREEARLRLASQTDALTQLLNRAGFDKGARQALAAPEGQLIGLLYLDLDKFKPVNDQHGHPTGDALLKAVALRLRHALRPADLVARLGGDEFAVLLPQMQDAGAAATVCDKLLRALSAPYHIGELELEIGVSIGYVTTRTGDTTLEALVASADASLYEAKRAGRARYRGGPL